MTTIFKAPNLTGFNPTGVNTAAPNELGPPTTVFKGRGAVPGGTLKRHPGAVADIANSGRRLAKARHGDGGGDGVTYLGRLAFEPPSSRLPAMKAKTYNTRGGKGSGFSKK